MRSESSVQQLICVYFFNVIYALLIGIYVHGRAYNVCHFHLAETEQGEALREARCGGWADIAQMWRELIRILIGESVT
jgi:hypothetical protein